MSTYAEFMGLYPPSSTLMTDELLNSKANPALKIRRRKNDSNANFKAVIDGYVMLPVFSYMPMSTQDDINTFGCNYVSQAVDYLGMDPKHFTAESNYLMREVGYKLV